MKYEYFSLIFIFCIILSCSKIEESKFNTNTKNEVEKLKEEAAGPEKVYNIAFVYFSPDPAVDNTIDGYIAGLKESGFLEKQNLNIIKKHSFGEIANLPAIIQFLENENFDLIAPLTTPVLTAVANIVKKTNCVFVHTYDPVSAGAGKSFKDHLPNITGIASFPPIEDTLKYMIEKYPKVKKIGTLYNASEPNSVKAVKTARDYIKENYKKHRLLETTVINSNEVYQAVQSLYSRGADIIWVTGDNTVTQAIDSVVKFVKSRKIPLIVNDTELVERGASAGIGISWFETGEEAGRMAARILKGESPVNIPIINLSGVKILENIKR